MALPQQRQHALAKLGDLRVRAFAPEQIAAQLFLELPDGARQEGWATLHSSAARVKLSVRATARKYRTWCISIDRAPHATAAAFTARTADAEPAPFWPRAVTVRRWPMKAADF